MGKNRNLIKTAALHLGVLLLMALGALNMKIGLAPTAFFFTLLAASAFSAVLILNGKKLNYLVTVPVFAAAYFISGNIFFAVFSFSAVIAGTLIAYGLRRDRPRIAVIISVSVFAGVFAAALILISYLCRGGSIKALPSDILAIFDTLKANLTESMGPYLDKLLETTNINANLTEKLTSAVIIEALVETVKAMSVAIIVVFVNVCSFIALYAAVGFAKLFGFYPLLPKKNGIFLPSKASAVIFSVSFLLRMITSMIGAESGFLYYAALVCMNLTMILLPCFAVMGIKGLAIRYRKRATRKFAVLMMVLCGFFIIFGLAYLALYLAAFIGASDTIGIYNFRKFRDMNEGNGREEGK